MNLHITGADPAAIVVELDVGMVGQQRHRDRGIGNPFGDHEGGEALAERVVVLPCVPDGDLFGAPRFPVAEDR
jgi:hypothetical protein